MLKGVVFLLGIFLLLSVVSASCSDVNIQINGLNMKYNFMKGEITSGETQIKEIWVYLDNELKMTDTSESFRKNILFPSFKEPLSIGQEIRIDIILTDGAVCKDKEVLIVSEDKIMAPTPECGANKKEQDWCVGDLVMGMHCNNGEWEEFIDVNCNYWNGTCSNGKCVEIGDENKILTLTKLDKSSKEIGELTELKEKAITPPNELENLLEENSSNKNSSENPINLVINWFLNLLN